MTKCVLITGASRGIGKAIALEFAKKGYDLILTCLKNKSLLEALQQELSNQYSVSCHIFLGDMGDFHTVEALHDQLKAAALSPAILINNAGISHVGLLTEMTAAQWQNILNTNLSSVFNTCRVFAPEMIQRQQGKIINISSVWGCVGASCEVAYSATKGGMNAFTRALAKELAPSNIQVNAVACGAVDTEMNAFLSPEDKNSLADEIPTGRFALPSEVGRLVLDLCTENTYLTGQVIKLDGGWI